MDRTDTIAKYNECRNRYGSDAPIAMLLWLETGEMNGCEDAQFLANGLREIITECTISKFEAEHGCSEDFKTVDEAVDACDRDSYRFIFRNLA
jgi:hypothetical protein